MQHWQQRQLASAQGSGRSTSAGFLHLVRCDHSPLTGQGYGPGPHLSFRILQEVHCKMPSKTPGLWTQGDVMEKSLSTGFSYQPNILFSFLPVQAALLVTLRCNNSKENAFSLVFIAGLDAALRHDCSGSPPLCYTVFLSHIKKYKWILEQETCSSAYNSSVLQPHTMCLGRRDLPKFCGHPFLSWDHAAMTL